MAKFTKLNIGDSVASSGGRVWKKLSAESAEDVTLEGTWVFNSLLDYDDVATTWYVDGYFYGIDETGATHYYPLKRIRLNTGQGVFGTWNRLQFYNNSKLVGGEKYCYTTNYLAGDGSNYWESYVILRNDENTGGTELASRNVLDDAVFRNVIITSKLSEVTNGDTLLTWLNANATKQSTNNLITFTIDGTSYQAEDGMTWYEWCVSEYNTGGYRCAGPNGSNKVFWGNGSMCVYLTGTDYVYDINNIIDNGTYIHKAFSGGGGAD